VIDGERGWEREKGNGEEMEGLEAWIALSRILGLKNRENENEHNHITNRYQTHSPTRMLLSAFLPIIK